MNPSVSILIPAFNAEKWLAATLESALSQTWSNVEIIVVDDGSSDRTVEVARRCADDRIKLIEQPHRGACAARNRALLECRGDYIQWLDADDLLASDKVELQLKASEGRKDSRVLLSCAWGHFYYRIQKTRFEPDHLWQDHTPVEWLTLRFALPGMMPNHAWLVSRKLTETAGPWDERLHRNQDGEYFSRVVAASERVQFVPAARCYYRKGHGGSITGRRSHEHMQSLYQSTDLSIRHLLALSDSSAVRAACATRLRMLLSIFDREFDDLRQQCLGRIAELEGPHRAGAAADATTPGGKKWPWARNHFGRLRLRAAAQWDRLLWELESAGAKPTLHP